MECGEIADRAMGLLSWAGLSVVAMTFLSIRIEAVLLVTSGTTLALILWRLACAS